MQKTGKTIIIYGDAGVGKTTLLNTLSDNTLVIMIESGEQVLKERKELTKYAIQEPGMTAREAIQRFEAIINAVISQKGAGYKYIALDNISYLETMDRNAVMEKQHISCPNSDTYNSSGANLARYLINNSGLRQLNEHGVNLIYIAWSKAEKIKDSEGEVINKMWPMLADGLTKQVCGIVDFVMPLRIGKKGERYLQLDADLTYTAKKREEFGKEYPDVIACPKNSLDTLDLFFKMINNKEENK